MGGSKDEGVDPYVRQALDDLRERSIRSEEQLKTVFTEMRTGFEDLKDRHESLRVDVTTTANLAMAHEKDIEEIKKAKASLWDKFWQFALMIGGAFAAAWAAVKVGGSK